METKFLAKQMIAFQKMLFENSFKTLVMIQDQTEEMVESFLAQMPWIPEEGKKSIAESMKFYKKAREDFRKSVEEGFARFESIMEGER